MGKLLIQILQLTCRLLWDAEHVSNLKKVIFFSYVWLQIALVEVGILPKMGCLREYFPLEKVTLFWSEYKCQGLFLTPAKLQIELHLNF